MRLALWLSLGMLAAACAAGRDRVPIPMVIVREPFPDGGEHSMVHGFVDDHEGRPVKGALVLLLCECRDHQREELTSREGAYQFRHLPPGEYTVQVLHGQANVRRIFVVAPAVKLTLNFQLPRPRIYDMHGHDP